MKLALFLTLVCVSILVEKQAFSFPRVDESNDLNIEKCFSEKHNQYGDCVSSLDQCLKINGWNGGRCDEYTEITKVCCLDKVKVGDGRKVTFFQILQPHLHPTHLESRPKRSASGQCPKFTCDQDQININTCGTIISSKDKSCLIKIEKIPGACTLEVKLIHSLGAECSPESSSGSLTINNGNRAGVITDFCLAHTRQQGKRVSFKFTEGQPIVLKKYGPFEIQIKVTYMCCKVPGVTDKSDECCPSPNTGSTTIKPVLNRSCTPNPALDLALYKTFMCEDVPFTADAGKNLEGTYLKDYIFMLDKHQDRQGKQAKALLYTCIDVYSVRADNDQIRFKVERDNGKCTRKVRAIRFQMFHLEPMNPVKLSPKEVPIHTCKPEWYPNSFGVFEDPVDVFSQDRILSVVFEGCSPNCKTFLQADKINIGYEVVFDDPQDDFNTNCPFIVIRTCHPDTVCFSAKIQ